MTPAPDKTAASTAPTAIPSGKLCITIASTSIEFFFNLLLIPSLFSVPKLRCGIILSIKSIIKIPMVKPAAAGKKLSLPRCSLRSIAGIKRLHTDAATITPAAKPISIRSMFFIHRSAHKKHRGRAERGSQNGKKNNIYYIHRKTCLYFFLLSVYRFSPFG